MTLTREPVPSREQVIAWVKEQETSDRIMENQCSGAGLSPNRHHELRVAYSDRADYFAAILTLLQSAETVAQERDEARRRWDDLKAWAHTDDEDERLNQTLNGIHAVRNKMRSLEQP